MGWKRWKNSSDPVALYQPAGFLKAVIAVYPRLAIRVKRERPIFGAPPFPPHALEDFLENMKPGEIATSADPPEIVPIGLSLVQRKGSREFYGEDDRLYSLKVLEKADFVPYMLTIHWGDDTVVPIGCSIAFADTVRSRFGEEKVDLRIVPGGEQGVR